MTNALSRSLNALREILHGMAVHEQTRALARQRSNVEHLFILVNFGDLLGLPILPPYYSLRVLPFILPLINGWKRRMLREHSA
ncbi:MAG: hypothetical protein ACOYZ8_18690 [Chloroflexota bacterium]